MDSKLTPKQLEELRNLANGAKLVEVDKVLLIRNMVNFNEGKKWFEISGYGMQVIMGTTQPPMTATDNEAALIAAVEAGFSFAELSSEIANSVAFDESETPIHPAIVAGQQAFKAYVDRVTSREREHEAEEARLNRDFSALRTDYALLADRERRLRAFVARVGTVQLGSNREMMMSMVDCIEEALALIAELGEHED